MALKRRQQKQSIPAMVIVSRPSFVGSRRAVAIGDRLTVGVDGITEEDLRALVSNGKARSASADSPKSPTDLDGDDEDMAPAAVAVAAQRRGRHGKEDV